MVIRNIYMKNTKKNENCEDMRPTKIELVPQVECMYKTDTIHEYEIHIYVDA